MSKKNIGFVIGLIVVVTIGGIIFFKIGFPRESSQKTKISIGIATWAGFGTGIVGMEKGCFPTIDLKTIVLDDARARQAAFVSGDIDIMISSIDLYAQEAAKKISGQVFLVTDESQGGDGIVAKIAIKTVSDLQGKKIAYAHGGPSDYFLFKVLDDAGIPLNKVKRITVDDPSRAGDVFLSGDVDAAVTWEPFLTNTKESGKGHILITTKEKPEIIIDILIANNKLANNKKLLQEFIAGWLKTVEFIKANPDKATEIMAKGLNIPVNDVKGMMAGLKFADKKRNQYFLNSLQPKNTRIANLFNAAGAYWKSIGIVKNPVDGAKKVSAISCEYFNKE